MNSYKLKKLRGINDLQNPYAFIGNSQGYTICTNNVEDFKKSGGWLSYNYKDNIDINDQEAINKEHERRVKENEDIVKSLKESGKYGEEYDLVINIQFLDLFDKSSNQINDLPLESYKMVFLDLGVSK